MELAGGARDRKIVVKRCGRPVAPERKPANILGISNRDVERLVLLTCPKGCPVPLNIVVDRCYDYLVENCYVSPTCFSEIVEDRLSGESCQGLAVVENSESVKWLVSFIESRFGERELYIVYLYIHKEIGVGEIAGKLGISSQLVSYYLKKFRHGIRSGIKERNSEIDIEVVKAALEEIGARYEK
jgi:hypothetical protein